MADKRKIVAWYSLKGGKHIPVYEGESKKDAINRALSGKSDAKTTSKASQTAQKSNSDIKQSKSMSNTKKAENERSISSKAYDKKERETSITTKQADNLNKEQAYRDNLAKGNSVSIHNDEMTFKGQKVNDIDLSERGTPGKDSLADYVNANGKLSPERMEVHRQIIEDYFKGHQPYAPGDEKVAMFTGGGGASGKGAFSKDIGKYYSQDKNPLVIDPDEIKKMLAKADGRKLDAKLTGYYHEESSALAKQIYSTSLQHNFPTFYDGTATGKGIYGLLDEARKHGYKSEMNFVYSDWKTVHRNSLDRYAKTGRFVPVSQVIGAHQKAYGAVEQLQSKFDSFKLWDNAGRKLTKVGESSLGKNLSISNSTSFERFKKSKAEFTLSTKQIDSYRREAGAITRQIFKKNPEAGRTFREENKKEWFKNHS
jgi:predicted ABC-type ATPase